MRRQIEWQKAQNVAHFLGGLCKMQIIRIDWTRRQFLYTYEKDHVGYVI